MRAAAFETILPNGPITQLPLQLVQTPSRTSPFLMLALAFPAALAVLAPFSMIAAHAAIDSSMFFERTATTVQLSLALVLWGFVFVLPLVQRTRQLGQSRTISITDDCINVTDRGLLGNKSWVQPLSAYRGIAHHVRSSLSGTRHELLLIHPTPSYSLLLRAADKIGQAEIDELGILLGCREIAPQVFYRNTKQVNTGPFRQRQAGLAGA
ncbi:MAG: hypothetical protein ABL901_09165 [Hyphomicrobiaceae bacterium]